MVATGGKTGRGEDKTSKKKLCVIHGENVMSAQMSEVFLFQVGTVIRLERDGWSTVKRLNGKRQMRDPPHANHTPTLGPPPH